LASAWVTGGGAEAAADAPAVTGCPAVTGPTSIPTGSTPGFSA
jgi:hypothetical protein